MFIISITCDGAVHQIDLITNNSHDKLLLDILHVDLELKFQKLKVVVKRDLRRMQNIVEDVED